MTVGHGKSRFTRARRKQTPILASVCIGVAATYAKMTLQRRWRHWLNGHVLTQWLTSGRYYQLKGARLVRDEPLQATFHRPARFLAKLQARVQPPQAPQRAHTPERRRETGLGP